MRGDRRLPPRCGTCGLDLVWTDELGEGVRMSRHVWWCARCGRPRSAHKVPGEPVPAGERRE